MRAPLTVPRLTSHGARSIRGGLVALAIVILVLTAALAAWPRATSGILTADLRYRMTTASAPTRDLQSSIDSSYGTIPFFGGNTVQPNDVVYASMPSSLKRIRSQMPASVRAVVGPGRFIGRDGGAGGQGVQASLPPHAPARSSYLITVEANPLLESDAVLVKGRWPAKVTDYDGKSPIEVVIAAPAAKTLLWSIGQTRSLGVPFQGTEDVKLVGTVKPRDESADYWQLDRTRAQAGAKQSTDGDSTTYTGLVWMNAGSWEAAGELLPGQTVVSWFPVNGQALTVETVTPTIADLQRFLSNARRIGPSKYNVEARYSTNLPSIADDFLARAKPASAVLSVVGTGPLGTGCAVVVLGIILLIDRRRPVIDLIRARGASERQMRTSVGAETAMASVPGAVLGGALALWLTPGPIDLLLVGTIVACALLPVAAAIVRIGMTRVRPAARARADRNPVRWVAELVVLLLAVLSVVLLLQRGITPATTSVGIDPLLTLAPILVVAVVALALLRAYPFVLRSIGSALRRRRGVVGYVGWASVARTPARFLSIFAVVAGVSITIFSFTILSTEVNGIESAELQKVGADVSVSATPIPADAPRRLAELPGVERVIPVNAVGGVSLVGDDESIALFTVDAKQLAAAQARLPASLRQFATLGTRVHGRPTVIAGGFQQKPSTLSSIDGRPTIPVNMVPLDGPSPAFVSDPPWILMNQSDVPAGASFSKLPLAVLIQLRPDADTPATLAAIRKITGPSTLLADTAQLVRAAKTAPVVSGFEQLTLAALAFSALLCAIALILTLLLNTAARVRLLARLRALGFGAGQSSGLIAWELGPLAILGVVAGLLVGLALPPLLLGAIDLAGFTGSVTDPGISLNPIAIGGTIVAFLVAAAVATIVAIMGARRARIAAVLRITGED
jgi:putative ABC transport system permease protein